MVHLMLFLHLILPIHVPCLFKIEKAKHLQVVKAKTKEPPDRYDMPILPLEPHSINIQGCQMASPRVLLLHNVPLL